MVRRLRRCAAFVPASLFLLAVAPITVRVDTNPAHAIQTVRTQSALGSAVDSDDRGKIPMLYAPERVQQMLASGLGTITYRLYTELSIQDWHWNPSGAFSDAAHQQGYWTSSAQPGTSIVDSFGYTLPHRGDTRDQGDDNGYSRIDDGDSSTYWKSNPYLADRPQWVVVDLGKTVAVNAVRIAWTNPYATRYRVEYWRGEGDAILDQGNGSWVPFAQGDVSNTSADARVVQVATAPQTVRWVRLWMTASSNTCDTHGSADKRNCAGYAIQDIGVGTGDASGFHDLVNRSTCGGNPDADKPCQNRQTTMWTSSTDPWHSENDRVKGDQDQPGVDIVSTSGITRGLPMIYAVPVFYSTPENAANELRYLEARHYPIRYVEMGEEVDGQYALPEDYADLYLQFATALHRVDPHVKLGGPIFEGFNTDLAAWPDEAGRTSWFGRFISYLRERGRLDDLGFMSFEHYPFHACDDGDALQDDLVREPALIRGMVDIWHSEGLPKSTPILVTESNFAADGGSQPQRISGALWVADYMAGALSSGIEYATYYQYEAEPLRYNSHCDRYGSYGLFLTGDDFAIHGRGASFYAAQMLTREWLLPGNATQTIYPVTTSLGDSRAVVTAYAAKRPNGTWSVLLVNKDFIDRPVRVVLGSRDARARGMATFGPKQYTWSARSASELPSPDSGISHVDPAGDTYVLPARSLTVLTF
ncbi:MAG: discoidin domain-containing protein [Candidatus Eremiobacteraeota bacterium]|nr:discoidin domain-containing protein [Candidatus Eremiobacteraeota bacterium]